MQMLMKSNSENENNLNKINTKEMDSKQLEELVENQKMIQDNNYINKNTCHSKICSEECLNSDVNMPELIRDEPVVNVDKMDVKIVEVES